MILNNRFLLTWTTNHIFIGGEYILSGLIGGSFGFGMSIIIRLELALPGFLICSSLQYNSCITFHGIFMIFFMIMPILIGGFGNVLIPLMLCCNDMIFPRLNALSLWLVIDSLFVMLLAMFFDGGVNAGWTFYVPLSIMNSSCMDLMLFSLHLAGLSSLLGSLNFIVSLLKACNLSILYSSLFLPLLITLINRLFYERCLFHLLISPIETSLILLLFFRNGFLFNSLIQIHRLLFLLSFEYLYLYYILFLLKTSYDLYLYSFFIVYIKVISFLVPIQLRSFFILWFFLTLFSCSFYRFTEFYYFHILYFIFIFINYYELLLLLLLFHGFDSLGLLYSLYSCSIEFVEVLFVLLLIFFNTLSLMWC